MKAFRGPNGWYTATENSNGDHYQPDDGGKYESKAAALAANNPDPGTWVDYDGAIYDDSGNKVGKAK